MNPRNAFQNLFRTRRALVGMLHVEALPGTPRAHLNVDEIVRRVVEEARQLRDAGFDGLLIENMHDRPYLAGTVGPEVTAAMTVVGAKVREAVDLPLGVQILAGANREALAVALACGAQFVRVEGFVFGHVGDEGWHEAQAGELLRYRRQIGADHIQIFADIKKKHASHALTGDVDLEETARAAEFFLADGLIVTGAATGEPASAEDVQGVAGATSLPTLVGSGITAENLGAFDAADALIVGSSIKVGGHWAGAVDVQRAEALVAANRQHPTPEPAT